VCVCVCVCVQRVTYVYVACCSVNFHKESQYNSTHQNISHRRHVLILHFHTTTWIGTRRKEVNKNTKIQEEEYEKQKNAVIRARDEREEV